MGAAAIFTAEAAATSIERKISNIRRSFGVEDDCYTRGVWSNLLEKLDPLAAHGKFKARTSGDVAAGMSSASDKTLAWLTGSTAAVKTMGMLRVCRCTARTSSGC
jgi:hypothetical protein